MTDKPTDAVDAPDDAPTTVLDTGDEAPTTVLDADADVAANADAVADVAADTDADPDVAADTDADADVAADTDADTAITDIDSGASEGADETVGADEAEPQTGDDTATDEPSMSAAEAPTEVTPVYVPAHVALGGAHLGANTELPASAVEVRPAASDAPEPATLDARNISAWFGDRKVLERVSLTMPSGRVTALIGPSGCGKSTFLRILNRMHELVPGATLAGEVRIDGQDIYDASLRVTDARRNIGMVFQKPNPFPAMSIYDNVIAGLTLTGLKKNKSAKNDLVEECLTKAGLWKEVKDRLGAPGGGLSGGQQQRLCIARSLAVRPKILLMDEPCSALDPTSTRRIEQTIGELAAEVTIVIVTHNMQQAQRVSDQCAFFLAEQGTPGAIVEHGPTDAMFNRPQDSRTSDYVNGRFG